jgi:hypothetical protein
LGTPPPPPLLPLSPPWTVCTSPLLVLDRHGPHARPLPPNPPSLIPSQAKVPLVCIEAGVLGGQHFTRAFDGWWHRQLVHVKAAPATLDAAALTAAIHAAASQVCVCAVGTEGGGGEVGHPRLVAVWC